jgi:hypothetical protein
MKNFRLTCGIVDGFPGRGDVGANKDYDAYSRRIVSAIKTELGRRDCTRGASVSVTSLDVQKFGIEGEPDADQLEH